MTSLATAPSLGLRPAPGTTRILWIDCAKGLGITLVVIGHVIIGLADRLSLPVAWKQAEAWIYSFHMPLFFLLAGLFVERGLRDKGAGSFMVSRLKVLLYPYLVWATVQGVIHVMLSGYVSQPSHASDLWRIVYQPPMQFWFLYVLFLATLLYVAGRRAGLGPVVLTATAIALYFSGPVLPLGPWGVPYQVRLYLPYFVLGCLIGGRGWTRLLPTASPVALVAAAAIGFAAVSARLFIEVEADPLDLLIALCGTVATLATAELVSRTAMQGLVATLGQYSLEIYLVHTICCSGIRIALSRFLAVNDPWTHLFVAVVVGLMVPVLFASLCYRVGWYFVFTLVPTHHARVGRAPRPAGAPTDERELAAVGTSERK